MSVVRASLRAAVVVTTLSAPLACSRPTPPGSAASQPTTAAAPPAAPATQPAAPAQPAAAAEPAAAGDAQQGPITGQLKLAAGIDGKIRPTDVMFVMARQYVEGGAPGMLVAVQRYENVTLPLEFKLGPENVMVQGTPFTGPFVIQARLDRDGDAMSKGPDDLYAQSTQPIAAGTSALALELGSTPPTPPAGQAPGGAHGGAGLPAGHPAPGGGLPPGHPAPAAK